MKSIVTIPNDVLTNAAKPVSVFDKKLSAIIKNMKTALCATKNPKGVGLAAPQIGATLRLFITRPKENDDIRVFINPEIIKKADEQTDGVPERSNKMEGCLSIPAIWGKVKRSQSLTLRYQDEQGKNHEEEFSGFLATIIQHETDHLNGILFTQCIIEQQGKLFQTVKDKEGKEILEEIVLK